MTRNIATVGGYDGKATTEERITQSRVDAKFCSSDLATSRLCVRSENARREFLANQESTSMTRLLPVRNRQEVVLWRFEIGFRFGHSNLDRQI